MRRKITSLSLLLLSGAVLFTSCVKDEEQENTKALRDAKVARESEKLNEEKAKAATEQAQAEQTLASTKERRIQALVQLQATYENDIKDAEAAIAQATDENASYAAKKTASEAEVARKKRGCQS